MSDQTLLQGIETAILNMRDHGWDFKRDGSMRRRVFDLMRKVANKLAAPEPTFEELLAAEWAAVVAPRTGAWIET